MAKSKPAPANTRQHCNLWGYPDIQTVASDISIGIHSELLRGFFVFAWTEPRIGNIRRLIVTRLAPDTWMYGIVTNGWTGFIPRITKQGLYDTLIDDLIQDKVRPEIIEDLKYFIEQ